jgi:adenylylsulfate kinase
MKLDFLQLKILTDFNSYIRRNRIRFLVRQDPKIIWFTGLSGAGKTTLSLALNKIILRRGYFTKVFDGDIIREGLCKDLGFSDADRLENIRRIAEVAKLFADHGMIVICSFISPTTEMRNLAKKIIGKERFIEVYVNCTLEVCENRDVKGLYAKARQGLIKNFTGIDSIYEPPEHPDIELRTDVWSEKQTLRYLVRRVMPEIRYFKIGKRKRK